METRKDKFMAVMAEYGYTFKEQEEGKLIFQKKYTHCSLLLVFNINQKYINPMVAPNMIIKSDKEIQCYREGLRIVYADAEEFAKRTEGKYVVLR